MLLGGLSLTLGGKERKKEQGTRLQKLVCSWAQALDPLISDEQKRDMKWGTKLISCKNILHEENNVSI